MKKRSLGKMLLLTFVTFGIYRLYWFVKTRREIMEKTKVKIPSPWILVAPIVVFIAILIALISSTTSTYNGIGKYDDCMNDKGYSTSSSTLSASYKDARDSCLKSSGIETDANPLLMIAIYIGALGYVPLAAWWLWNYCKGVEEITGEKLSFAIALIILLAVPDGIDIMIVQDYFNKVPDGATGPAGPTPVQG